MRKLTQVSNTRALLRVFPSRTFLGGYVIIVTQSRSFVPLP
jgi:hypothetical protein